MPGNQHDSEASFVSHHPSVSFGSPESFRGQRNGFDHRTDLLQGQESACLRRERRGRGRQVSEAASRPDLSRRKQREQRLERRFPLCFLCLLLFNPLRRQQAGREEQVLRAAETWIYPTR